MSWAAHSLKLEVLEVMQDPSPLSLYSISYQVPLMQPQSSALTPFFPFLTVGISS